MQGSHGYKSGLFIVLQAGLNCKQLNFFSIIDAIIQRHKYSLHQVLKRYDILRRNNCWYNSLAFFFFFFEMSMLISAVSL